MPTRRDRRADAVRHAAQIRVAIGQEIRDARTSAGASLRAAGNAVGMSHAQFGRIERAAVATVSVDQLARACTAVGLKLVVRSFPDGDPVRDAAQLALLGRFRARLPGSARVRTEVPLPLDGDRRAWDMVVTCDGGFFVVEAETRLRDLQALERRIALKQRDGAMEVVVLLVSDTAANRRILNEHGDALRPRFPLNGREILAAVRTGAIPIASGLIFL